MFNRKHWDFTAEAIRKIRQEYSDSAVIDGALSALAWEFADRFAEDNDKFDADRFFNATVDGVIRRPRKTLSV
jgi:hypothetical protein